jgi:hypothetical protein
VLGLLLEPIRIELKHSSDVHDWWLTTRNAQYPASSFCDSPLTAVGTGSTVVMDECWLGDATALLEECLDGERGLVEGIIAEMIQHGLIHTSRPQPEASTDKQEHGSNVDGAEFGGDGSGVGDDKRHGEAEDYSGRPSSPYSDTTSSYYYSSGWSGSDMDTGSGSEWWSEESYSDSERPFSKDDTADGPADTNVRASARSRDLDDVDAGCGGAGQANSTEGGFYDALGIMIGIERPPSLGPVDSDRLPKAASRSVTPTLQQSHSRSRPDSRSPFNTRSRLRAGLAQEFGGDSTEQRESTEPLGFVPVGGVLDGGGNGLGASVHSVASGVSGGASLYPVKTPQVTSAFEEAEIAMRRKLESGQVSEVEFKVRNSGNDRLTGSD